MRRFVLVVMFVVIVVILAFLLTATANAGTVQYRLQKEYRLTDTTTTFAGMEIKKFLWESRLIKSYPTIDSVYVWQTDSLIVDVRLLPDSTIGLPNGKVLYRNDPRKNDFWGNWRNDNILIGHGASAYLVADTLSSYQLTGAPTWTTLSDEAVLMNVPEAPMTWPALDSVIKK